MVFTRSTEIGRPGIRYLEKGQEEGEPSLRVIDDTNWRRCARAQFKGRGTKGPPPLICATAVPPRLTNTRLKESGNARSVKNKKQNAQGESLPHWRQRGLRLPNKPLSIHREPPTPLCLIRKMLRLPSPLRLIIIRARLP